jgi:putative glutamine amidotransferase
MPESFHTDRDVFEKKIVDYAVAKNIPLLGICRGLQLVNVLNGGSLIQDAGEAGNALHRSEHGKDKEHEVSVIQASLLFEIAGTAKAMVNSAHHQSAEPLNLGNNLMVNALSNEGIIEGLEYADKQDRAFMICVQWHPERMTDQHSPLSRNLLQGLLRSISST